MGSLVEGFLASTERFGCRPALWVNGESYTYAELARYAGRIATRVAEDPSGPSLIGVLAHRSLTAYAGVLAALMAGRGYVPLHPKFPAGRTRTMRELSGVTQVVVGREGLDRLGEILASTTTPLTIILPEPADVPEWAADFPIHRFVANDNEDAKPSFPLASPSATDAAYLLFTSGSTGEPKGVPVSHANARSYVEHVADRFGVTERDRFSQVFDLTFDLSVHDMFVCWERGACLYCLPDKFVMAPTKFIRDQRLTMWFSVPSTVGRTLGLRMLSPGVFPDLRVSLFCGEPLPVEYASAWQDAAPNSIVENLYGPTEATIAITSFRWHRNASGASSVNGIVPIGQPFPGQRARVVDRDDQVVPAAKPGELCVSGSQVTDGYLNDPAKTRSQFVRLPGCGDSVWYRTGDLVTRGPDGCLHYLGRIDHQVKVRGFRVELQEIEHVIRGATSGAGVVAVPWPVRKGSAEGIVAFISTPGRIDLSGVLARCKQHLPEYMVPRRFIPIDSIPLNVNGKVDRQELSRRLQDAEV